MVRRVLWAAALVLGAAVLAYPAISQTSRPLFTPQDERIEDLPDTPGRDETFGLCVACHGYRIVSNQGMSRERWDETLTWMTERHNMPDLQGADRDLILDYLARHHPPKAPSRGGGFRNPFAPQ